jgi:hypothetical protein
VQYMFDCSCLYPQGLRHVPRHLANTVQQKISNTRYSHAIHRALTNRSKTLFHWSTISSDSVNQPLAALFGCMYIHLNPHVLEWNGMKFSSIPLQSTSIHVNCDEYMNIQTRPTV